MATDSNGSSAVILNEIKTIVGDTLNLGGRVSDLTEDSALLGAIPELDSMAVVGLITALEDHFGIAVADDEIDAQTFATFGSLSAFVERKLGS
jgi:acyl carrier protein